MSKKVDEFSVPLQGVYECTLGGATMPSGLPVHCIPWPMALSEKHSLVIMTIKTLPNVSQWGRYHCINHCMMGGWGQEEAGDGKMKLESILGQRQKKHS